ncbi:hypothetical protein BE11_29660 [Sorangium cellulosum]|nr:hypothetical protein BE11_29660 [Sorangium cellulosum]
MPRVALARRYFIEHQARREGEERRAGEESGRVDGGRSGAAGGARLRTNGNDGMAAARRERSDAAGAPAAARVALANLRVFA